MLEEGRKGFVSGRTLVFFLSPPSPCCQPAVSLASMLWVRRGLSVNTAGRHTKGTRSIPGGMVLASCLWLRGRGSPA